MLLYWNSRAGVEEYARKIVGKNESGFFPSIYSAYESNEEEADGTHGM